MEIKPFTRTEKIIVFFACALGWAHDAIGLTLITALAEPIQTTEHAARSISACLCLLYDALNGGGRRAT